MVDKTLVLRKLAEIDQYLLQVKEYAGISLEQYESSWKTQRIIERTLQMMIETCVDIAGHIISVMILRVSRQQLFRYWNKTMRRDRRRSRQIPPINFPFVFSIFRLSRGIHEGAARRIPLGCFRDCVLALCHLDFDIYPVR